MKKGHTENTVGPWARQKLDGLEAYLNAYTQALKYQKFDLIFIDAFAGAGKAKIRDAWEGIEDEDLLLFDDEFVQAEAQYIEGSPKRALGLANGFNRHYFFDADPARAELLEALKGEFPKKDIRVQVGDANPLIQELARGFNHHGTRGVAFLDPYGPHLDWQTVVALAETKKFEVIVNFPLGMAINRLITRTGDIPDNWRRDLDKCFGTNDWEKLVYDDQPNLFGDIDRHKVDDAGSRLLGLYVDRLKGLFNHVATPSVVRNTRGVPIYYMIWAGQHGLGYKIADHILKQGEKVKAPKPNR